MPAIARARVKPGARNVIQISHVDGKDQALEASSAALQDALAGS